MHQFLEKRRGPTAPRCYPEAPQGAISPPPHTFRSSAEPPFSLPVGWFARQPPPQVRYVALPLATSEESLRSAKSERSKKLPLSPKLPAVPSPQADLGARQFTRSEGTAANPLGKKRSRRFRRLFPTVALGSDFPV